jgi:hypothetical protein
MNNSFKIFGAKAEVYLKYQGKMDDLANLISKGLILPKIKVEPQEYPPHEPIGMCEALGFEVWIEKSTLISGFHYLIKIETELSLNELVNNQMFDLSPWLARYISKICDINSCIIDSKDQSYIYFEKGNPLQL